MSILATATHLIWAEGCSRTSFTTLEDFRTMMLGTPGHVPTPGFVDLINDPLDIPEMFLCEELDDSQIEHLYNTGDYPPPRTAGVRIVDLI